MTGLLSIPPRRRLLSPTRICLLMGLTALSFLYRVADPTLWPGLGP
jgi:hypothetical protein